MENKKRLIIFDSNSVIHRAYHIFPFFTTKKGEEVGAIYGFFLFFLKTIKNFQPDFIAACFDLPSPTFRHKIYKEYKAKRPPMPKELSQQIPKIKEVLKVFNISIFEKEGFEADDLIGTITNQASKQALFKDRKTTNLFSNSASLKDFLEIIILSNDSDMFQLVNFQTKVCLLCKGVKNATLYNEELVKEKLQGLTPKQLLDFKALRGDPSDNIPGVTGIGEKTATKLVLEFDNLENLYQEIKKNSKKVKEIKPKIQEILIKYKEQAFLSKKLAEIKTDVLTDFDLEKCFWGSYNKEKAVKILKDFEFYSLVKKL